MRPSLVWITLRVFRFDVYVPPAVVAVEWCCSFLSYVRILALNSSSACCRTAVVNLLFLRTHLSRSFRPIPVSPPRHLIVASRHLSSLRAASFLTAALLYKFTRQGQLALTHAKVRGNVVCAHPAVSGPIIPVVPQLAMLLFSA